MASRRKPRAAPGLVQMPASSGPRCRRRCAMSSTVSPLARAPIMPTMPHMARSLTRPRGYVMHRWGSVMYRLPSGSSSFRVQPGEEHMATPADQRLLELLEKWLSSLELHAKYSSLDDDSYSR